MEYRGLKDCFTGLLIQGNEQKAPLLVWGGYASNNQTLQQSNNKIEEMRKGDKRENIKETIWAFQQVKSTRRVSPFATLLWGWSALWLKLQLKIPPPFWLEEPREGAQDNQGGWRVGGWVDGDSLETRKPGRGNPKFWIWTFPDSLADPESCLYEADWKPQELKSELLPAADMTVCRSSLVQLTSG